MNKTRQNILVIRLSSIGDVLLASPLLRLLRERFPGARIDFVVKSQFYDLVRTNPHIDVVHKLDTDGGYETLKQMRQKLVQNNYDCVVDIHNNFRSHYLRKIPGAAVFVIKKYKLQRFFLVKFGWNFYKKIVPVYQRYVNAVSPFGVTDDAAGLDFFLDPAEEAKMREMLSAHGFQFDRPTLAIAPGASFATKRWPIECFVTTIAHLKKELNLQFLLLGDASDALYTRLLSDEIGSSAFDFAGKLNLMQTACALNCADALLTNDTGLMHLATALKKSVVAIFGPTVKELGFFPVGKNAFVLENEGLSCRPCSHIGRTSCPKKHFKCMREIDPQRVLKLLLSLFDGK